MEFCRETETAKIKTKKEFLGDYGIIFHSVKKIRMFQVKNKILHHRFPCYSGNAQSNLRYHNHKCSNESISYLYKNLELEILKN